MKSMKKAAIFFALIGLVSSIARSAESPTDAAAILRRTDATMNAPKDQSSQTSLKLIEKNGTVRERSLVMYQKGADRRLVRFLTPADQKGIAVLSLPKGEIWLYLPAFKKAKRIASHVKNGSFAGTDFSYSDMEAKNYVDIHDAAYLRAEGQSDVIELKPRPEAEAEYARIVMTVDRASSIPTKIEYYDAKGVEYKLLVQRGIEKSGAYWIAREREMTDLRTGHRTVFATTAIKFDTGIKDELFTVRSLEE
jgi:outer membrane lipoprotein-sorting protein